MTDEVRKIYQEIKNAQYWNRNQSVYESELNKL